MFPITYKNRFIYMVQGDPHWAADKLREHLAHKLEITGVQKIIVDDKHIWFTGSWESFRMIRGTVMIDCHKSQLEVAYQINFIRYYLLAFPMLLILVIAVLFSGNLASFLPTLPVLMYCSVIGLFIAMSIAMDVSFFKRFMKDSLREFFNSVSGLGVHSKLIASH